jgi:hypothetical protein
MTNTPERTPMFRKPNFGGRKTTGHTPNQGASAGGASSKINSQLSTPRGGSSSTQFKMAGHDPMIKLPEFQGEASKDLEKNLFICENIWKSKQIKDEDTKLTQLEIVLRDHALDWYMSLDVDCLKGIPKTITDIKKLLVNEFQKPNSEY